MPATKGLQTVEVTENPVSGSLSVGYELRSGVPRTPGGGFEGSKFGGNGKRLCKFLRRKRLELLLSELP